jgi:hypothetical protein
MKLHHGTAPDSHTAFRLPKELLSSVDSICDRFDLTRSQVFRRSLTQFIKSLGDHHDLQTPPTVEERPTTGWSPELYDRLQRKK